MNRRTPTDLQQLVLQTIRGPNWRPPARPKPLRRGEGSGETPPVAKRQPSPSRPPLPQKEICGHCGQIFHPWNAAHVAHHAQPAHRPLLRAGKPGRTRWRILT